VIRAIQDGGVEPSVIYGEVLAPSLCELGRLWHLGEISVAEEHFATTTAQMVMSEVLSRATPAPHDGRVVLAASVEGDSHDMGVRILADLLELSGWRAIFLGSNVPADELAGGARDFGADLVAVSATLPVHLRAVEAAVMSVHALPRRCPVLVGGPAFCRCPESWRVVGADAYAACAVEAVRVADALVPRADGG
jgi:methanogenic corrinoid protein MtbC1